MMKSKKKFRIAFIQLTGYLKPSELQLYSYADTDERLIYCYELAKTFANDGMNVDIFTRLINEEGKENFDYSRREQQSADANLKIIRINCGPTNKFINQTKIWRYINEFANNIVNYISLNRVNIEFFITTTPESTAAALLIKKKLKIPYIYLATSFLFDNFFDKKITKTSIDSQFKKNKWHIFYEIEKNILKYSDVLVIPNYLNFEKLSNNIFYRKILNSKNLNIQRINTGIFSEKIEEVKNTAANIEYLSSLIIPQISDDRKNLPCILTDFKNKKISADNINNLLKLYDKSEILKNKTNVIIVTLNSCDKKSNYDDLKKLLNKYNKTQGIYIVLLKDYLKEIYYIFDYFKKKESVYFYYSNDNYNIGNSMIAALVGLPIILNKNLRANEFIEHNKNGLMFVNIKQAENLLNLLFTDEKIYKLYSEKAIRRVENNYLWKNIRKKYYKIFEALNNCKQYINVSSIIIPKILEKNISNQDEEYYKTEFTNFVFGNN